MKRKLKLVVQVLFCSAILTACGGEKKEQDKQTKTEASPSETAATKPTDPMSNKGIGPVSNVELGELDNTKVEKGEKLFSEKCSACHKVGKRYIGPQMAGVLERRTPEWVMNMILNTEQMVNEDPIAMDLLKEFLSPMANQSLTEEQARTIVEYFRTI